MHGLSKLPLDKVVRQGKCQKEKGGIFPPRGKSSKDGHFIPGFSGADLGKGEEKSGGGANLAKGEKANVKHLVNWEGTKCSGSLLPKRGGGVQS